MTIAKTSTRPMGPIEWTLLITLAIIWGGSFFLNGVAVHGLPPLTIVVLRLALAAIVLNGIVHGIGLGMPKDRRTWAAFFGMGFLNNLVPFSLIVWGQTHIASGLAAILNATAPLFAVIMAHFLISDEEMTGGRVAGVLAGLAGVVVMIGPEVLEGLGVSVLAQLAILGAAISFAFAGVFGRRFGDRGVAPLVSATGQVTASTAMLIPVVLAVDQPWRLPMPGAEIWSAVVGLGLLATALGYVLYFRILRTAGATNIQMVAFLIPGSAIFLGAMILGERLDAKHFAGLGLIGLGLAAIDGRPLGYLRRRFTPKSPQAPISSESYQSRDI